MTIRAGVAEELFGSALYAQGSRSQGCSAARSSHQEENGSDRVLSLGLTIGAAPSKRAAFFSLTRVRQKEGTVADLESERDQHLALGAKAGFPPSLFEGALSHCPPITKRRQQIKCRKWPDAVGFCLVCPNGGLVSSAFGTFVTGEPEQPDLDQNSDILTMVNSNALPVQMP